MKHVVSLAMMLALMICIGGSRAMAQEAEPYRIGPDDELSITFWSGVEPLTGLAQQVVVRQDGAVALPVIGDIRVAGLTAEEAGDRIADRISRYNRSISQVLVQVIGFRSRRVVVAGEVASPGVYPFEVIPNLWSVIHRAGGPTESADLTRIKVVSPSGILQIIDLAEVLAAGSAEALPPLSAGSTVEVPVKRVPAETFRQSMAEREPIIHVTGEVRSPGMIPADKNITLYDAIALAGGFSPAANAERVTIVSKGAQGPASHTIDLRPRSGARGGMNYQLQYEDLVIVEARGPRFSEIVGDIAVVVSLVSSITTLVVVLDR